MSDAAIVNVVTGAVTVAGLLFAYLRLRLQVQHGTEKMASVEGKLDDNTRTTAAVDAKTDTIVKQTNGSLDALRSVVQQIHDRVSKLEDYNHDSAHRVLGALNDVKQMVAVVSTLQQQNVKLAEEHDSGGS